MTQPLINADSVDLDPFDESAIEEEKTNELGQSGSSDKELDSSGKEEEAETQVYGLRRSAKTSELDKRKSLLQEPAAEGGSNWFSGTFGAFGKVVTDLAVDIKDKAF